MKDRTLSLRYRKVVLFILFSSLIYFTCVLNVSAAWDSHRSFLGNLVNVVATAVKWFFKNTILALLNFVADSLYNFIAFLISPAIEMVFSVIEYFLGLNPRVYPLDHPESNATVSALILAVLKMIIPFYGILAVLIGIYIIYVAVSPNDRAMAKAQFNKLMMSMFLVSISPPLFQLLLDIQLDMTRNILNQVDVYWSDAMYRGVAVAFINPLLGWWPIWIGLLGVGILAFRYIVIQVLAIFFPLAFFLFFFDYTRHVGGNLLRTTMMWIFMPVGQAMVLAVTVIAIGDVEHALAQGIVVLAGLLGFAIAGLMITGMLKWVGGMAAFYGASNSGSFSGAMATSIGQIGMGMGPSGLVAGAAEIGYMRLGQTEPGVPGMWGKIKQGTGSFFSAIPNTVRSISDGAASGYVKHGRMGQVAGGIWGAARGVYGRANPVSAYRAGRQAKDELFDPDARSTPKHPDKVKPGGGANKGKDGGGGTVEPSGEASDDTPTSRVQAPGKDKVGGVDGALDDQTRYVLGERTGGQRPIRGEHSGYPQVWWEDHVQPLMVNMDTVRRAADRGSSHRLRGASLLAYAYELSKTPGASRGAIAGAFIRGVAGVGFALMPISPFEPIRQIGAFVVGVSSQMLPPGFRGAGYWVGDKMMGLGFRQVNGRFTGETILRRNAKKVSKLDEQIASLDYQLAPLEQKAQQALAGGPQLTASEQAQRTHLKASRATLQNSRDKAWSRVKNVVDSAREGSGILAETDQNFYQQCLTYLENKHSHKDPKRDLFKQYMDESQSKREGTAHPGNELVGDLHRRMTDIKRRHGSAYQQNNNGEEMTDSAAWEILYRGSDTYGERGLIVDLDDKKFKKHIDDRVAAGTLSRADAAQWGKERDAVLGHFKAQRVGFESKETVEMTERKTKDETVVAPRDAAVDDKEFSLSTPMTDTDAAFREIGDYSTRVFRQDGVAAHVQLTAGEKAAAAHLEHIVDPQTNTVTLAMNVERTESGEWYLSQSDYNYLKQRMSYEGGSVQYDKDKPGQSTIRPVYRESAAKKIEALEKEADGLDAQGDAAGAQAKRAQADAVRADKASWATDSEGKFMVRNYAREGRKIEVEVQGGNHTDAARDFFHAMMDTAEKDPLYQTINAEGGRNAEIAFTTFNGLRIDFNPEEFSQRQGVWGMSEDRFRGLAKQYQKAGQKGTARAYTQLADAAKQNGGFLEFEQMVGPATVDPQTGQPTYRARYTPSAAMHIHFDTIDAARKYVEESQTGTGKDAQGQAHTGRLVFLEGSGVAAEQYVMGEVLKDGTTVDHDFLEKRAAHLESVKSRGVYMHEEEAAAMIQMGYSGQQINDFLAGYADHIQSMPERMRPNAIKFEAAHGDDNPYSIEKNTGTIIFNIESGSFERHIETMYAQDPTQRENMFHGLVHEGGHLLLGDELSAGGAQRQVRYNAEEHVALTSTKRTGLLERKYEEQLSSQGIVDGLDVAMERQITVGTENMTVREALVRSGYTDKDKGMAESEALSTRIALSLHDRQIEAAQQQGDPQAIAAAEHAKLEYIHRQATEIQKFVTGYEARAQAGAHTGNDTANMAHIKAVAEHLADETGNLSQAQVQASQRFADTVKLLENMNGAQQQQGTIDKALDAAQIQASAGERKRFELLHEALRGALDARDPANNQKKAVRVGSNVPTPPGPSTSPPGPSPPGPSPPSPPPTPPQPTQTPPGPQPTPPQPKQPSPQPTQPQPQPTQPSPQPTQSTPPGPQPVQPITSNSNIIDVMPESVKNNDVFNKMASMSLDDVVAETRRRADTVKKNTGMELDNDGYAVVMTGVLYPEMNNASYQLYQKDLQTYQSMVPVIQDLVKVASGDSSMQEFVSRQEKRFRDGGDNDEQGTQRT